MIHWFQAMVMDREANRFTRFTISTRKENSYKLGEVTIKSVMLMTAFLTRHVPVVSRTGRTSYQYQLLLMKASDRGQNVKIK